MTVDLVDANRLLDNARTNLPGALDTAITQSVFNVLNDFFTRSNIWWEDITFPVDTTMVKYSTTCITPTQGGAIVRLLGVFVGTPDTPRDMGMPQPGTLTFYNDLPSQAETWTARCVLTVTDPVPSGGSLAGFPQAPDWVLTRYNRGLTAGVTAEMMAQVGKPYSNLKMAALHAGKFAATIAEARADFRRQNVFGTQAWRFPKFA